MLGPSETAFNLITVCRVIPALFVLLTIGCDSTLSTDTYSADPITAWVVDAKNGKPIEGANVLAVWEMKYGLENHGTNYAMVLEAVTDGEGKFSLPAWGPKAVKVKGALERGTPRFVIVRYGYRLGMGANRLEVEQRSTMKTESDWNGKTFTMQRFEGSDEQYADYIGGQLRWEIERVQRNGCHASEIPRFLLSMDQQFKELATRFPGMSVPTLNRVSDTFVSKCGNLEEAVRKGIR